MEKYNIVRGIGRNTCYSISVFKRPWNSTYILYSVFVYGIYGNRKVSSFVCGSEFVAYKIFDHVKVRVAAWIDPWSIIDDKGYQITQSLFAIGTGGLFGMGLYEGMPNSIPVVDQDFIFSAISEEFGAIFAISIIMLSMNIFFIFIRTAFRTRDDFYRLICAGVAVAYGIQMFLTVGGAIKLIPSTGVTYPLLSYGGSSLVATIFMFFIVQGVKINEEYEQ